MFYPGEEKVGPAKAPCLIYKLEDEIVLYHRGKSEVKKAGTRAGEIARHEKQSGLRSSDISGCPSFYWFTRADIGRSEL